MYHRVAGCLSGFLGTVPQGSSQDLSCKIGWELLYDASTRHIALPQPFHFLGVFADSLLSGHTLESASAGVDGYLDIVEMAPRIPVPLREIQYSLSPYQQDLVKTAVGNAPHTAAKFIKDVRHPQKLQSVYLYCWKYGSRGFCRVCTCLPSPAKHFQCLMP